MPKFLRFSANDYHVPEFQLGEDRLELLRQSISPNKLAPGWEDAVRAAVNNYLIFFKHDWSTTTEPMHRTYRQAAAALRKAARILADGSAGASPDHMRWARQFHDSHRQYDADPTMAALVHMLAVQAANLDRADVWLTQNEIVDARPGRKPNEAMSTLIWRISEMFEEHGLPATDAYTEAAEADSDIAAYDEAGAHDTPFIRFMNALYAMLPEQAKILESESKYGPMAHPIRRVLKDLRKRRREAGKG